MLILVIYFLLKSSYISSLTTIPVSRMDCHTPYELESGFKPVNLEIEGLRRNIEVIITDREIDKVRCKGLEGHDFCSNGSQFCRVFGNRTSLSLEIKECWLARVLVYFNNKGNSSFSNAKITWETDKKDLKCSSASIEQWKNCLEMDHEICAAQDPLICTKKCLFVQCSEDGERNFSHCLPSSFKLHDSEACGQGSSVIDVKRCGFSFPFESPSSSVEISLENKLLLIFLFLLCFFLIFLWIYRIYRIPLFEPPYFSIEWLLPQFYNTRKLSLEEEE